MVRVGQVVESCEVDRENTHTSTADSHSGRNPVNGWKGGPAKPEQANG